MDEIEENSDGAGTAYDLVYKSAISEDTGGFDAATKKRIPTSFINCDQFAVDSTNGASQVLLSRKALPYVFQGSAVAPDGSIVLAKLREACSQAKQLRGEANRKARQDIMQAAISATPYAGQFIVYCIVYGHQQLQAVPTPWCSSMEDNQRLFAASCHGPQSAVSGCHCNATAHGRGGTEWAHSESAKYVWGGEA
jgi:hypothetical protein